ncbi:MAG TPA: hypothetical protein VIR79_01800 [Nitrospira sp.]
MLELLLVLGGIVAIGLVGLASIMITPQLMVELGFWVLAGGLLIGIPTGLWYHVALYRQLSSRMTLPRRWWRAPVELHPQLTAHEYRQVRPWFVVGAVGFLLCCLGGIAAIIGLSVIKLQE